MKSKFDLGGIGMTSQRTRDRLIARLREQGISDEQVLETMRTTPDIFSLKRLWPTKHMKIRPYQLDLIRQYLSRLLWRR